MGDKGILQATFPHPLNTGRRLNPGPTSTDVGPALSRRPVVAGSVAQCEGVRQEVLAQAVFASAIRQRNAITISRLIRDVRVFSRPRINSFGRLALCKLMTRAHNQSPDRPSPDFSCNQISQPVKTSLLHTLSTPAQLRLYLRKEKTRRQLLTHIALCQCFLSTRQRASVTPPENPSLG